MRRVLLSFACALFGCGESPQAGTDAGTDAGAQVDAGPMLTAEQQEWLTAHNAIRAAASNPIPATALPEVTWNQSAANLAADWASRCNFMHRDPNTLGENIFAATNSRTPTQIVNGWAAEKPDYNYANNSCTTGRQCGHYTQIVWRATTGIGCASQMCTTGSPFSSSINWVFVVCNYVPAGNIVGQRPY
ncbi:MAG: hypothetical protein JNM17_29955 [Archangium sp.]|nr:hypothetical protein [Archangium sp.]